MSRCAACGAEVWFGLTALGKRMPIDPHPCDDGNVIVDRSRPGVDHRPLPRVRTLRKAEVLDADVPRYKSHFATCPHADAFRSPAEPASAASGSVSAAREPVPSTQARRKHLALVPPS